MCGLYDPDPEDRACPVARMGLEFCCDFGFSPGHFQWYRVFFQDKLSVFFVCNVLCGDFFSVDQDIERFAPRESTPVLDDQPVRLIIQDL